MLLNGSCKGRVLPAGPGGRTQTRATFGALASMPVCSLVARFDLSLELQLQLEEAALSLANRLRHLFTILNTHRLGKSGSLLTLAGIQTPIP